MSFDPQLDHQRNLFFKKKAVRTACTEHRGEQEKECPIIFAACDVFQDNLKDIFSQNFPWLGMLLINFYNDFKAGLFFCKIRRPLEILMFLINVFSSQVSSSFFPFLFIRKLLDFPDAGWW